MDNVNEIGILLIHLPRQAGKDALPTEREPIAMALEAGEAATPFDAYLHLGLLGRDGRGAGCRHRQCPAYEAGELLLLHPRCGTAPGDTGDRRPGGVLRIRSPRKNALASILRVPLVLSALPHASKVLPLVETESTRDCGPSRVVLGGPCGDRTRDLRFAGPALSQLSYSPKLNAVREEDRISTGVAGRAGAVVPAIHRLANSVQLGLRGARYRNRTGCLSLTRRALIQMSFAGVVSEEGFEPPVSCSQGRRLSRLGYSLRLGAT